MEFDASWSKETVLVITTLPSMVVVDGVGVGVGVIEEVEDSLEVVVASLEVDSS